ncbi:MAG: HlyD family efflux transporter periplasmic adaptor subunit [Fermentimonas sp.]|mgnify:FL=1|jgi:HlyD family secretion protein|nr:HlyD family efflux transporter periplasmic adaptor subunit [Fermentimonas sp.]MDD4724586.1 HlyD family efflux transporter periplasmic adaptor subunit [Fermentimonas sp.]NLC86153.1 HlyD family efflux transporter periplasmic adaptor subunit [Bacteroidales bacterium]
MNKKTVLFLSILMLFSCISKQEKDEPEDTTIAPSYIVGIGKVLPQGGIVELAAPASGIVKKINVNPGNDISRGDLILTLYNGDEELSIKEADLRIQTQEIAVESAKIILDQERIAHADHKRKLEDTKELLGVGATTGENVRTMQSEFDQKAELLKKLENDYRLQQSQLSELRNQRALRVNDLEKTQFRSPIDGTLLDISPLEGEAVSMHQQYGRLSPDKPLVVMVEIDELFADKLEMGQACQINLHGDSEVAATGKISRISPDLKKKSLFSDSGTDLEDRRVREIEVSLDEINKTLFIESKVECRVQIN